MSSDNVQHQIYGTALCSGTASGNLLVLDEPLSFWGGIDIATGCICDTTHPQCGQSVKDRILAMPAARGSSSSSSALVEMVRLNTAPRAIIMTRSDSILAIGVLVAENLYRVEIPMVLADPSAWSMLENGLHIDVDASGDQAILRLATGSVSSGCASQ